MNVDTDAPDVTLVEAATFERPDIVAAGAGRLGRIERAQIAAIRRTFQPGLLNRTLRFCQRAVGSGWITFCTRNLVELHGVERLPSLRADRSFICVSNHRSFFDMYVVTGWLVKRGLPHRMLFPVRANFFYDSVPGFVVNGAMSFFAMYPPVFSEKKLAAANLAGLRELAWLLRQGGTFAGIHPEGMRNRGSDPYQLLAAQSGVGKVIHEARVAVLPVFINGLINDLPRQVRSNFDGTGRRVNVVFGAPVDCADLLERPGSPRTYRAIAERALERISMLGAEERSLRAAQEAAVAATQ